MKKFRKNRIRETSTTDPAAARGELRKGLLILLSEIQSKDFQKEKGIGRGINLAAAPGGASVCSAVPGCRFGTLSGTRLAWWRELKLPK